MLTMHWTKGAQGRLRMEWRVQRSPEAAPAPALEKMMDSVAAPVPARRVNRRRATRRLIPSRRTTFLTPARSRYASRRSLPA